MRSSRSYRGALGSSSRPMPSAASARAAHLRRTRPGQGPHPCDGCSHKCDTGPRPSRLAPMLRGRPRAASLSGPSRLIEPPGQRRRRLDAPALSRRTRHSATGSLLRASTYVYGSPFYRIDNSERQGGDIKRGSGSRWRCGTGSIKPYPYRTREPV
jgi:hypothetical protein